MWEKHKEDENLSRALGSLDLHSGVALGVMREVRRLAAAERAASILLYAAMLSAIVSIAAFLLWNLDESAAMSFMQAMRTAACVGGVLVGLALTFGAKKLSELDALIMRRLTGRCDAVTLFDVVLVRAGAVAILLFTSAVQFA